ncbi:PRKC apoptosis WT1 regulator protein isoform X1 [Electrophorus electricus]|uniref:PRKC apoptosis WT1 regulator protein isoform X1 n=1 Tax=Electrophorus electricus TaxID=8005 RepID=UPI0015CFE4D5|nr:PRKC apoptosis WT1 regulator protein isoform X1 [Electrophorus electricus]
MASGGFRSHATTDFLEEWKAKREKMRAKMLGDIAAASGVCAPSATPAGPDGARSAARSGSAAAEMTNNGHPAAPRKPDDDPPHPAPAGVSPKKADAAPGCGDSDQERTAHGKGREKKSCGPSARKGKGQIEKRKLREKRRSTGVVSIPSNESLDELDDDDGGEKERKKEEALTQLNTAQNESMTSDTSIQETPRSGSGRHKGEDDLGGNRHRQSHGRHAASANAGLERRIEELEKELAIERQENARLLKAHQDKDELIVKLKEEIDLVNRVRNLQQTSSRGRT